MAKKPKKPKTKAERWAHHIGELRVAFDEAKEAADAKNWKEVYDASVKMSDALSGLDSIREEYSEWFEAMPEGWQNGDKGQAVQAMSELDTDQDKIESIQDVLSPHTQGTGDVDEELMDNAISELETQIDELEGADLP